MNMFHSALFTLFIVLSGVTPAFSADSTTIAGRDVSSQDSIPAGFVAVWPLDAAIPKGWLPCDGQAVPVDCPTLRGLMSHVPNYNTGRQFLRGATSGAGTLVADSVKSHAHAMDQHSHTVSGSAGGQAYQAPVAGGGGGYATFQYSMTDEPDSGAWSSGLIPGYSDTPRGTLAGGGVYYDKYGIADGSGTTTYVATGGGGGTTPAYTGGGSITGVANAAGPTSTHAAGSAETAPAHTLVKYIIKAH